MGDLQAAFEAFASFGGAPSKDMDNSHFNKMMKEAGIVDKVFTVTDSDLLFNKVKAKGERRLSFGAFRDGVIPEVAAKKKTTPEAIAEKFCSSSPQSRSTQAEATRFHDDKSQYTGVYKAGGPTNVDRDPASLSSLVDRRVSNDIRGAPLSLAPGKAA